jgi:acyl-CoA thioester hydrolase
MPMTYTRNFRVRYYECDAYGHVNNANYVRYMQETAFDASNAAGYGLEKYQELCTIWLVRRSNIEFLRPLFYNDRIALKTWVEDFRHSSSRRKYEFTIEGQNSLAARAHTDWVYVNSETFQPAPIPTQLQQAFFPEGVPTAFLPRENFPHRPALPKKAFSMQRHVDWQDIDSAGLVNNPCYLDYVSECGFQAIAAHQWPWERMVSQGFGILLRQMQIQYFQPARYGDMLEISTWISSFKQVSATRFYEIRRQVDNAVLAQVFTLGVWVNLNTGLPVRFPAEMLQDFSDNISSEAV